jgi:DNA-binding transcriptional LysR family regulator
VSGTIGWEPGDALVFAQVVAEGSFTAAARALELPKSTVSRRVSRLEEALGVQLLRRTTRKLSLTDAGRAFHTCAQRAVEALESAERAATALLDEPRGRLRVTAPVELGTRTFGVVLGFCEAHPQVQLELELSNRFVNLVEEGFDVALRGGRPPEGALTGRSLGAVEIHLVASPAYLARRGAPKRTRDLEAHDAVVFPSWVHGGAWVLQGPRGEVRAAPRGRLTVNNLEAARLAARAGLGIALLPDSYCTDDVAGGSLVRVLPRLHMRTEGLWVVYSRTRFPSAKVRAFVDHVVAELGDAF